MLNSLSMIFITSGHGVAVNMIMIHIGGLFGASRNLDLNLKC